MNLIFQVESSPPIQKGTVINFYINLECFKTSFVIGMLIRRFFRQFKIIGAKVPMVLSVVLTKAE